jgi:hypothetical protein
MDDIGEICDIDAIWEIFNIILSVNNDDIPKNVIFTLAELAHMISYNMGCMIDANISFKLADIIIKSGDIESLNFMLDNQMTYDDVIEYSCNDMILTHIKYHGMEDFISYIDGFANFNKILKAIRSYKCKNDQSDVSL